MTRLPAFPAWLIDEVLTAMEDGSRYRFQEDLIDLERAAAFVADDDERKALIARIRYQMQLRRDAKQ